MEERAKEHADDLIREIQQNKAELSRPSGENLHDSISHVDI